MWFFCAYNCSFFNHLPMSFCFFCSTDIFRLISDIFNIPFAYYKIDYCVTLTHVLVLVFLFSYLQALESSPQPQQRIEPDPCSSENAGSSWDDFSDTDIFSDDEVISSFCTLIFFRLYDLIHLIILLFSAFSVIYCDGFC